VASFTRGTILLVLLLGPMGGCGPRSGETGSSPPADSLSRSERLMGLVGVLASDSLEGRGTATPGSAKAADFIAAELERYGLQPAFDSGFLQTVELIQLRDDQGRTRMALGSDETPDGMEVLGRLFDVNVGGVLWGSDPGKAGEMVVVSAHFDHLGVRPPPADTPALAEADSVYVEVDSIYNGADDDGTGVAAVLEIARSMAKDGPGERTVLFLLITGEEMGILGTRWYLQNPVFPLDSTVANLNIEMLGRPGPEYEGAGRGWLTGYERSTMGELFTAAGLAIIPDPFPDRGLFFGSDNIGFAMEGIPAHTVSSSDLHSDYHTPDDEFDRIEFGSMTQVVEQLLGAVRVLTDGEAPVWKEGGRPEPRGGRE
jgi:hypothetical protein